jgi:hypothetical protein
MIAEIKDKEKLREAQLQRQRDLQENQVTDDEEPKQLKPKVDITDQQLQKIS